MHRLATRVQCDFEELLAELTDAVYRVALQHGIKGPFLECELDFWNALRSACVKRQGPEVPGGSPRSGAIKAVEDQ